MDKQEQLREALRELFALAKQADNHLTKEQVTEVCRRISLDERQREVLCAYLERNHLTIEGYTAGEEPAPLRDRACEREDAQTGEDAVSFQAYLKEIKNVKPWQEKEEADLIGAMQAGDPCARKRLIEGNLHLVVQKAQEYLGRGILAADLVQEGNLALMDAMDSLEAGEDLQAHLMAAIANAMEEALKCQSGADDVGRCLAEDANALMKATEVLAEKLEREATAEELADYLHVSPKRVKILAKISLDALNGCDE